MSIVLNLDNVPYEEKLAISKKDGLCFEKKKSNYIYTNPETINAYELKVKICIFHFNMLCKI